jgi:hypothetical protein
MVLKLILIILGFILFVFVSLKISSYYEAWHRKIMDKHEENSEENKEDKKSIKNQ